MSLMLCRSAIQFAMCKEGYRMSDGYIIVGSPESFILAGTLWAGLALIWGVIWFMLKVHNVVVEAEYYRDNQLEVCRNCIYWCIRRVRYYPEEKTIKCPCVASLGFMHPLDWCDEFDRWERAEGHTITRLTPLPLTIEQE